MATIVDDKYSERALQEGCTEIDKWKFSWAKCKGLNLVIFKLASIFIEDLCTTRL